jgi:hypothetical protein
VENPSPTATRSDDPKRSATAWRKKLAYKLATYFEGWKLKQHERQFAVKQMRVAIVTTSQERIRNMQAIVDDITEGRGTNFFLFTDAASLSASNPLDTTWTSGKRGNVRLTD